MMQFHDEPPQGAFIRQGYGDNFFPKEVQRLGDNMFLVTYTKDAKGRSNVRYKSIMYWSDQPRFGGADATGRWRVLGTVKRNRVFHGHRGINVYSADYGNDSDPHRVDGWFVDTDLNYDKATNLLVAVTQIRWPEEFYDGIHCR